MALTSENFIEGKMNKSVDERLVPKGQYIDALNVRLGSTENTEIGAVENSKGNSRLSTLEYQGEPLSDSTRTIGCFEDGINETIYWFVHDDNNIYSNTGVVDMIVSYNTNTGTLIYHVISIDVLNFNFKYLVTGVSKIENLLFFTDDFNPPRMINVTRDYEYPASGVDVIEEEDVSVIVKPPGFEEYNTGTGQVAPLGSPHIELLQIAGEENYMETRFLSFAYRYRYEDGQYSATSLFSDPAFQPNFFQLSYQNFWNQGMENKYNACNVTFSTGSKRVKEVDLLYKQTTSNVIYVIKRYVKEDFGWADNDFITVQFSNSEIYTTLGSDELLRLYDNVPRVAKAQTIQGNRLMYGNYIDGYDIRKSENGSLISIDYNLTGVSEEIAGVVLGDALNPSVSSGDYTIGAPYTQANSILTWDLADLQPIASAPIVAGTTISFQFSIEQNSFVVCSTSGTGSCAGVVTQQPTPFSISMTFICPVDYNSVSDMLESQEFKDRIGGSVAQSFSGTAVVKELYPCNESNLGGTLSDKFYDSAETPMIGTNFTLVTGGVTNSCSASLLDTNPFPILCGGQLVTNGTTTVATTPTPGLLTDSTATFTALTPPLAAGDVVINSSTNEQTTIATVISDTELVLDEVTPGSGDYAGLDVDGVGYVIESAASTSNICPADGFVYSHSTTLNPTQFSIQVPAGISYGIPLKSLRP